MAGLPPERAVLVVVSQVWRQPALRNTQFLTFARGVALHLILVDLAHGKVLRLRVSEVPTADRRRREHCAVSNPCRSTWKPTRAGGGMHQLEHKE